MVFCRCTLPIINNSLQNVWIIMNIERLFELAGLPNNDLLLEAAYDNMITAIKQKFPERIKEIDDNIKQAKTILKKQDRMVWYIKVLRAYLLNDINSVKGEYNFSTIKQFNDDLFHYYGLNINEVENVEYKNQNISELFQKLNELSTKYQKSDKAPVPVKHGDYELIHFPDGSGWWFIDRGYCEEEGRSGKHCGNVVGKHQTTQRILSLRTPNHNVILTFVLLNNGFLGEMKAKANLKPKEQYHPQIMQLLLNPIVNGIKGAGYAPWMNFSIFDLSEQNIQVLINHGKQSFISDQIVSEPIEFLKAPSYIKNNPEYQQIAVKALPALNHLIGKENDSDAWWNAIHQHRELIIYAPNTLKDFNDLVFSYLRGKPEDIMKAPKTVSQNFDILSSLLDYHGSAIQYVMPNTPRYNELCEIAISGKAAWVLDYVPEEQRTLELCKLAVTQNGDALEFVPKELRTLDICKLAVHDYVDALNDVPFETFTHDEQLELCKLAVTQKGNSLGYVPKELRTLEICKLAVTKNEYALVYVPKKFKEQIKQELNIQESLDLQYFQNL